jgi:hypothetical protein
MRHARCLALLESHTYAFFLRQAILLALEGEEAPLQRLLGVFLGCNEDTSAAEPGEVLASADAEEVVELMKERSGSHLVEVKAPLFLFALQRKKISSLKKQLHSTRKSLKSSSGETKNSLPSNSKSTLLPE